MTYISILFILLLSFFSDLSIAKEKDNDKKKKNSEALKFTRLQKIDWKFNRSDLKNAKFKKLKKLEDNNTPLFRLKFNKKYVSYKDRMWTPTIYRGILKPGSRLLNIKTGKVITNTQSLNIVYRAKSHFNVWALVFNNKKKLVYETKIANILRIEKDLKISHTPGLFIESSPISNAFKDDKNLTLNNSIVVKKESFSNSYFNTIFEQNFTMRSNSLEVKIFYSSDFPLDFGLTASSQSGTMDGENFLLKFKSLYLGPEARYLCNKSKYFKWHIGTSMQQSINFEINSFDKVYSFSNILFQLNTTFTFPISKGDILIGANLNHFRSSTEEFIDDEYLMNKSEKNYFQSYGIFLGYNFRINL